MLKVVYLFTYQPIYMLKHHLDTDLRYKEYSALFSYLI